MSTQISLSVISIFSAVDSEAAPLNALNTSPSHLLRKFSLPPNLNICTISSPFNLLTAQQRVIINGLCSSFIAVISGVPQCAILGPLLFVIIINNVDDGVVNKILTFADDTKIASAVAHDEQIKALQLYLYRMFPWSQD